MRPYNRILLITVYPSWRWPFQHILLYTHPPNGRMVLCVYSNGMVCPIPFGCDVYSLSLFLRQVLAFICRCPVCLCLTTRYKQTPTPTHLPEDKCNLSVVEIVHLRHHRGGGGKGDKPCVVISPTRDGEQKKTTNPPNNRETRSNPQDIYGSDIYSPLPLLLVVVLGNDDP